jgi:hypothetical protein
MSYWPKTFDISIAGLEKPSDGTFKVVENTVLGFYKTILIKLFKHFGLVDYL